MEDVGDEGFVGVEGLTARLAGPLGGGDLLTSAQGNGQRGRRGGTAGIRYGGGGGTGG